MNISFKSDINKACTRMRFCQDPAGLCIILTGSHESAIFPITFNEDSLNEISKIVHFPLKQYTDRF